MLKSVRNEVAKISVIVPVYNSSSSLRCCIESILNQSYDNFELLLVNDGSQDNSGKICEEYAHDDKRINVFHKPNGGVSSARNLGISKSKGDHIVFCDADDQVDNKFLEELLNFADYDIVLCGFISSPNCSERIFPELSFTSSKEIGKCLEKYLYTGFSMPWAKLYSTQIIKENRLLFDENLSSGEDTLWIADYLAYVKSVKLLSYIGYRYYKINQSALSVKGIPENTMYETIDKIKKSYERLERIYRSNLTEWKLNVAMYFFHRHMLELSTERLSSIFISLKNSIEKPNIRPIFFDRKIVLKGGRLKIFNFMARNRLILPLAIYVKIQKRYL